MGRKGAEAAVRAVARDAAAWARKHVPLVGPALVAARDAAQSRAYRRLWADGPVDPGAIVFESFEGRRYADSPRAIYQQMLREGLDAEHRLVWALRTPIVRALQQRGGYVIEGLAESADTTEVDLDWVMGAQALEELRHAVIVPWKSNAYRSAYATAGLWVTNTVLPRFLTTRPGQSYLQTWHGTPLKRLGCDIPLGTSGSAGMSVREIHERYRREGRRLTWLVSPSPYATARFRTAFDLESTGRADALLESGYPRNDVLHRAGASEVAAIRARFGIAEGKKVALYAPTWRENQHVAGVGYTFENVLDFARMRERLGPDWVVLYRAHVLVSGSASVDAPDGFVIDVSDVDDVNDLYIVSDALITDYSSVFFDFANVRRPMIFFVPDLNQYAGVVRGLYLAANELPGPVVATTDEVVSALLASGEPSTEATATLETFARTYAPWDDGHAAERVLERVLFSEAGRA